MTRSEGSAAGSRPFVARALLLSSIGLALAGCNARNAYVAPPPPKVVVAQPLVQPVTRYFELTGNTVPFASVDLVARVQGFLASIDYADGASVKKGDLLFGIERAIYQAQLDQAKATLASNQAEYGYDNAQYERQATLAKNDFASKATLQEWQSKRDQASAGILGAKASIEVAETNLGYTRVLAPFDGTVTNHLVDIGALVGVSGATRLASIIQTDPLYVFFNLSEPQVLTIKRNNAKLGMGFRTSGLEGVPVEIGMQGEDGWPHEGRMDYASPQVDQSTGTLLVRAVFDNKNHALLPGLFVRVRTPVDSVDKAVLTLDTAIGASQEGQYVLTVGADNVVQRKIVRTGQKQGQLRVIESGLDASDWVVTEGVQRAFPGAKVDPQRTTLAAPASPERPASK